MIKIYLDTCIVIYLIEKHPIFSGKIENAIQTLTDYEFCYSSLVEMECLVMPIRLKDKKLKNLFETFFAAQTHLLISSDTFKNAALLRADFPSLKTPDAIHLTAAQFYNCDEFWTNDNRLENVALQLVKNIFKV